MTLYRLVLLVFCPAASLGVGQTVVVNTPLGSLIGEETADYSVFRGIPYAEVPSRFEAPTAKLPWASTGTLDATKFSAPCPAVNRGPEVGADEDCLFANVWRPRGAENLPVFVWIHGGGFYEDSAIDPHFWLDGLMNNRTHPVVGVTFNYRLGAFGFYASKSSEGNFGIMDQQLALRWVQDNIASFGGDRSRVTLAGQSAGAMSCLLHMYSPASSGLFHRVWAASPVGLHYHSAKESYEISDTTAHSVGCWRLTSEATLECLKRAPMEKIRKAMMLPEYVRHIFTPCKDCVNWLPWLPTVGGNLIPTAPIDAFEKGLQMKIPTVISSVRNETDAWVPTQLKDLPFRVVDALFFKAKSRPIREFYDHSPDTAQQNTLGKFSVALTDALFTCYVRHLAKLLSFGGETFLSTFLHAPGPNTDVTNHNPRCHTGGTCHGSDVLFMIPNTPEMQRYYNMSYAPGEEHLAQVYSDTLLAFVHGESGVFYAYHPAVDPDRGIGWGDVGASLLTGYHQGHCDFMEGLDFASDPWGSSAPTDNEVLV